MNVAFLLFPNVTQLDLTGPAQFLSRMSGAQLYLVAASMDPVPTDCGFSIVPNATFEDLPRPDILCVPGGFGTEDAMEHGPTLDWVRGAGEAAQWVTSVCTGSLLLGAAGLLRGYKATSHWASREHLALFGATPVEARVVVDRNRVTGGGVTSGIDFALRLIAEVRDEEQARLIQLALEYDPQPGFGSGSPAAAGPNLTARYRAFAADRQQGRAERLRAAAERMAASG